MKKILIACVGNVFHGDDAFGCEVARVLQGVACLDEVQVIDFGIRSYDLAYALGGDHQAVILVDAASRGGEPGTLYLIEPDLSGLAAFEPTAADPHTLDLVSVIRMAQSLGGVNGKLYLVGCEPAVLESDNGEIGLSGTVRAAVPQAMLMIDDLVKNILAGGEKLAAGLVAA